MAERIHNRRPQGWVPRRTKTGSARICSYETLLQVENEQAWANLLLPKMIRNHNLDFRDAGFATEITYGTLRYQGFLDALIGVALQGRKIADIDASLRVLVRMGAYQIIFMRVPPHAAVNETVNITREVVSQSSAKLVNAALRRAEEYNAEGWKKFFADTLSDKIEYFSTVYSLPSWQVRAFQEALAANNLSDTLEDFLASNLIPARATLCVKPGIIKRTFLSKEVENRIREKPQITQYSPWGLYISGNPGRLESVKTHQAMVQDEGSQIVAGILAQASISGGIDQNWLDLCAGPGGKASILASLAASRGIHFVANESQEHRASLVENALYPIESRYPNSTTIWCSDGRSVGDEYPDTFDRILVDVPCSGLGTVRRRPEVRWNKTTSNISSLRPIQKDLLESAYKALRPGGVLAFSTCSPHLSETRLIVDEFIRVHPEAIIQDAVKVANGFLNKNLDDVQGPYINLWPHLHDTEAMFLALINKPVEVMQEEKDFTKSKQTETTETSKQTETTEQTKKAKVAQPKQIEAPMQAEKTGNDNTLNINSADEMSSDAVLESEPTEMLLF